ncbi:DUF4864 domain-containing protein [Jannaschia sp. M317]|uniref:DUF4864 domain-containing protein n=1 Tax=Jannaschia sp. M317 TaxID=2867011 RepID=UPI0021A4DEB8|nr:DUF4864 domain-containing protein [Jannaschia sp. M317]UWQ18699.1 DUF4864 domain-containing protein [Jannaschia sp. M317]
MKGLIAGLVVLAGAAQADEAAIQGIIGSQIDAFIARDVETAFGFAAPNIQGMFRTPEIFGQMVEQGYPMVWTPDRVEYLSAIERGAVWTQEVLVTDGAGRLHKLAYMMIETDAGWKIGGVQVLTAPIVGA